MSTEAKPVTIKVHASTRHKLKVLAAQAGKSMLEYVRELVDRAAHAEQQDG